MLQATFFKYMYTCCMSPTPKTQVPYFTHTSPLRLHVPLDNRFLTLSPRWPLCRSWTVPFGILLYYLCLNDSANKWLLTCMDLLLIQLHCRFVKHQEHMAGWTCRLDSLSSFLYYLYQNTKYIFGSEMLLEQIHL